MFFSFLKSLLDDLHRFLPSKLLCDTRGMLQRMHRFLQGRLLERHRDGRFRYTSRSVCVYIYKYTYITYLLCICYMYSNYVIKHYATKQKDAASTPPITKDNAHLQVVIKLLAYKGHQFFKVNLSTSTILKRIRFIQESILQSESRLVWVFHWPKTLSIFIKKHLQRRRFGSAAALLLQRQKS